jgi:NADH-quinone oxidoreductase subunit L
LHELASGNLVWLIPGLPLIGFFIHAFLGKKLGKTAVGVLASAFVFASFAISVIIVMQLQGLESEHKRAWASLIPGMQDVPWIDIAGFTVYFRALIDPLSMLMCLIVTGVGGLIHVYATGYMKEDKDFTRFFTYLNLFIFFMLMLVLGENILLMFVGWEGVGLCSYLLISFWYEDKENSKAGNKAFIVNRVGDVGFALGIFTIFATFGTLTFYTPDGVGFLDKAAGITEQAAFAIGILLFIGACGKSAQFPLHVWLPDAMAGPTPVSALIHAATMVTAGVVMITRVSPIIVHSQAVMNVITVVGLFTAIFAATIALTQNDIKKVLAYSTVSQLGYMFLGCGVGAFSAGMFHVMTHAFFKALLFLGAGSVIYAMHHEQDMRKMGGLKSKIPITYRTMWFGWLAICGIALSGFWSKDEILGYAAGYHGLGNGVGYVLYGLGLATASLTAFYMTRLMWKTFWSNQRFDENALGHHGDHGADDAHGSDHGADHGDAAHGHDDHAAADHGHGHSAGVHETPAVMWVPLVVLAFLAIVGGFIGTPWANYFEHFLEPSIAKLDAHHGVDPNLGLLIGTAFGALGIGLAWSMYSKKQESGELVFEAKGSQPAWHLSASRLWYVDSFFYMIFVERGGQWATTLWKRIDQGLVDGVVNGLGAITAYFSEVFRRAQTGYVRNYAMGMLLGIVVVVGLILGSKFGAGH